MSTTMDTGEAQRRQAEEARRFGKAHGVDVDRLREVGKNLGGQLEEQVHKRPYAVVGAAVGVGFVLGSLLGSRIGQVLLAAGIGYAVKNAVEEGFGVESIEEGLEKLMREHPSKL